MGNPWAGEVAITVDGVPRVMRLTLGALAELEAGLGEASIIALIERFEAGRFSGRDVLAVPTGSGVFVLMKTPLREMFVMYSWMNWSKESNSLLIVTRGSWRDTVTSPADRTARCGTRTAR
jgi:hypothetical protein